MPPATLPSFGPRARRRIACVGRLMAPRGLTRLRGVDYSSRPSPAPYPSVEVKESTRGRDRLSVTGRVRVLVIEDEGHALERVRSSPRGGGSEVVCSTTGEEGLEVCARVRPDLVLVDLGLWGMVARTTRASACGGSRGNTRGMSRRSARYATVSGKCALSDAVPDGVASELRRASRRLLLDETVARSRQRVAEALRNVDECPEEEDGKLSCALGESRIEVGDPGCTLTLRKADATATQVRI